MDPENKGLTKSDIENKELSGSDIENKGFGSGSSGLLRFCKWWSSGC